MSDSLLLDIDVKKMQLKKLDSHELKTLKSAI